MRLFGCDGLMFGLLVSPMQMDGYFLRLEAMASRSADSKHGKLSVRVKFIIQEILDLRRVGG